MPYRIPGVSWASAISERLSVKGHCHWQRVGGSSENGEKNENDTNFVQWKLLILIDSDLLRVFLLLRFDRLNLDNGRRNWLKREF